MDWAQWMNDKAPFLAVILIQFRLIFLLLKPLLIARSLDNIVQMRKLAEPRDDELRSS